MSTQRESIPLGNGGSVVTGSYPTYADTGLGTVQGLNGRADGAVAVGPADESVYGVRTPASTTITIAGSPAEGDTVTVNIFGGGINPATVVYTVPETPTATSVALGVIALLRAHAVAGSKFLYSNAAGVISVQHLGGILGNSITLTTEVTGTVTAAVSDSPLVGGAGPFRVDQSFSLVIGKQVLEFRAGTMHYPDAAILAAIYASPDARDRVS